MTRKSIADFLTTSAVFILSFGGLFVEGVFPAFGAWSVNIFREITAMCRDTGTQWMLVVCLAAYFLTFSLLEWRLNPPAKKSSLLSFAFVALCLANYAGRYETAVRSTQVLVLLAGMVLHCRAQGSWSFDALDVQVPADPGKRSDR